MLAQVKAPPRRRGDRLSAATVRPRVSDIVGIITKRAIADAVIDSFED